jgi:hypothetical protein
VDSGALVNTNSENAVGWSTNTKREATWLVVAPFEFLHPYFSPALAARVGLPLRP